MGTCWDCIVQHWSNMGTGGSWPDRKTPGTTLPSWMFCDLQPVPCPLASARLLCKVKSSCHIAEKALPASDASHHPLLHRIRNATYDTTSRQSWGSTSCLKLSGIAY